MPSDTFPLPGEKQVPVPAAAPTFLNSELTTVRLTVSDRLLELAFSERYFF